MARELKYVISGDERDFTRALKSVDAHLGRAEKRANRFGKVMNAAIGVGAVGALGAVGKKAIDTASDIDESLSKNTVLFGQHAKAIDAFAKDAAGSFGISRQAALEATGTFGNLFTALDIAPKAAADMSVGLTKLAADLASFNNASPEEALEAIRSGLVGETEPLRKFGVNLNDAALRAEALSQGLIKTTKDALTPQQKALAVNALLFKQTGSAQGDFARTSEGLANQQRILKAELSNVTAELGTALLPVAKDVATAMVDFIQGMKDGTGAGGDFADALRDVRDVATPIVKFLKDHPELIAGAAAAWATYKTASLVALGAVKVANFRNAFAAGKGAAAAEGALAGAAYSTAFGVAFATLGAAVVAAAIYKFNRQISDWINDKLNDILPDAIQPGQNVSWETLQKIRNDELDVTPSGELVPAKRPGSKPLNTRGKPTAGLSSVVATSSRLPGIESGSRRTRPGRVPRGGVRGGTAPAATGGGTGSSSLARFLSKAFNLRFSSGYRSPEHNAAAGGVPGSWHTRGSSSRPGAIDLVGATANMQAALAWAQENVPGLAEAMIHDAGSGLHLHLAGPGVMNWNGGGGSTGPGAGAFGVPSLGGFSSAGISGVSAVAPRRSYMKVTRASRGAGGISASSKLSSYDDPAQFAASLDLAEAQAGTDKGALARVTQQRISAIKLRLSKIDRALKGSLSPATRARLVSEKASLVTELASLGERYRELTAPVDPFAATLSQLEANIVDSQLRGDKAGELSTLRYMEQVRGQAYDIARGTPGFEDDIAAGRELQSVRDAIKSLEETVDNGNALLQQQLDLEKQRADRAERQAAVIGANSETILRAFTEVVNGKLGVNLGLGGKMLASAPGRVGSL